MGVSGQILAPCIAFAVTVAAMQAAVVMTAAMRRRDYRRFEDKGAPSIAEQFRLPTIDPAAAEARRKSLSPFVNKGAQGAIAAQTTYHNAVVRSAGCLVLAFIALAIGGLRPEDWPARLDWPAVELLLSWIDVLAVISVLVLFFYGRRTSRPWIVARAGAELLRQYQFLDMVFPNAITPVPVGDLKAQFNTEADRVAAQVQGGDIADIVTRIEAFWSERKASIASAPLRRRI
jgi:hypothetical protein